MSLLLRKSCQETLNAAALNDFHVGIAETTPRYLQVVGSCGKPLVTIYGIQFSKINPNEKEIEYATELFEEFINKHVAAFKQYLKARAELDAIKLPELDETTTVASTSWRDGSGKVITYRDGPLSVTYSSVSKQVTAVQLVDGSITADALLKYKFSKLKMNQAQDILSQYITHGNKTKELDKIQSTLSACAI